MYIFIVLQNSISTISVATNMLRWHQQNWGDFCDRCGFSTSFDNMVSTYRDVTETGIEKKNSLFPLFMGNLRGPPQNATEKYGLIQGLLTTIIPAKNLLRPHFLRGLPGIGGVGPLDFHDPSLTRSWGDMKLKPNGLFGLVFFLGEFLELQVACLLVSEVRCGYKQAERDIYIYKCATCNTPILYTIFGEQTARDSLSISHILPLIDGGSSKQQPVLR